jgi:hypothetical protein
VAALGGGGARGRRRSGVQEGGEFGRGGAGQGGELPGLLIAGVRWFGGRYFELEELRQWWFGKVLHGLLSAGFAVNPVCR